MEEKVFVGFNYGTFVTDDGEVKEYCNVFMLESFSGDATASYHFGGQKAVKYGCDGPSVFAGIDPGTKVECYFNSRKKITKMISVNKV